MTIALDLCKRNLDAVQTAAKEHDFTSQQRPERCFENALSSALLAAGHQARLQVPYFGTRLKCDVGVCIEGHNTYLEVKLLFPDYWAKRKQDWRDRQRLLEPLILLGKNREKHSAAQDIIKLASFQLPHPHYLGILVVASCTEQHHRKVDFAQFGKLAALTSPWIAADREFPNPYWPEYSLDARVWICPANEVLDWWRKSRNRFQAFVDETEDSSRPTGSGDAPLQTL
jgi:hypothetical protein